MIPNLSQQLLHKLEQYQHKHNLSQNAVAKLISCSSGLYSDVLNGYATLSSKSTLAALALISGQTNVTMFLSRRKTDSVADKIQRGINIIQDITDDDPDAPDPTNRDFYESDNDPELDPDGEIDPEDTEDKDEFPNDEDQYPDQIILRKDMLARLTSRRIRSK